MLVGLTHANTQRVVISISQPIVSRTEAMRVARMNEAYYKVVYLVTDIVAVLQECSNVILIFSIKESGKFQGRYARSERFSGSIACMCCVC